MNSLPQGKDTIVRWIKRLPNRPEKVLDVGAGCGTYYDLLKEQIYPDVPEPWIDGIEVWPKYIEEFDLRNKYRTLYDMDARAFNFGRDYDLVIFGDILEHMKREDAIKLVNKAKEHCSFYIVSIPVSYCPQGEEHGNPYQKHIRENYNDEIVDLLFGPFFASSIFHCVIGNYGKVLNRPIDLGVYLGEGNVETVIK